MSTPGTYFAGMYAETPDPWHLAERWYETRKRALTLASLPRARYRSAFEPGCSVGLLTEALAPRCGRLLAADREASAVRTARERVAGHAGVRVERLTVPDEWPDGTFDLVVLSELGYYLGPAALDRLLGRVADGLEPGGDLVAVHWRHPVAEHAQTGDEVHRRIDDCRDWEAVLTCRDDDLVLQVWSRVPPDPVSVAAREGLC